MAKKLLSLETLGSIRGGALQIAIDQALMAAIHDCRDRPTLNKSRCVTLKISIKPKDGSVEFEDAEVMFDIAKSFPAKSLGVNMVDDGSGLLFQPMASDNPRQNTLVDGDEPDDDE